MSNAASKEPKVETLAEASGLTMADAMRAINELNAKFATQNEENAKLRAALVNTQAQVDVFNAKTTSAKFGAVEIVKRQCNACGQSVEEGKRCTTPGHKRATINEIGMGSKHNRMQPIIVRQL